MNGNLSILFNQTDPEHSDAGCVSADTVTSVHAFHAGISGYAPTPLLSLPALSSSLGVSQILVKDESKRFGLNAFKSLGGSYAIAKYVCDQFGLTVGKNTIQILRSPQYAHRLKEFTFVTATDGNHGRGVAWAAKMLGCQAVVYLPAGSSKERLENILALGAKAEITNLNYDDTVRYAEKMAKQNHWSLIQDTAWEGYEEIPTHIMQGYTTLACEIVSQLKEKGFQPPTHLFLQAGVGSMAGAIAGYFFSLWKDACPDIILVEPDQADCLYQTAKANDGTLHTVSGRMNSMMAGLCCGEPCTIGWKILKNLARAFISCDDSYAAHGMQLLGKPVGSDPPVISGESGAVTIGVAAKIMREPDLAAIQTALALSQHSRILVISTEGDTDRENYRRILNAASL
ncbi:MAG: diaminopropionate ammonia-lyase [Oscillospiraceae bacterium]|nr:diaminopropionate ammonia-lyase [Oscillospiraceae bacterium]